MQNQSDFKLAMDAVSDTVGKKGKTDGELRVVVRAQYLFVCLPSISKCWHCILNPACTPLLHSPPCTEGSERRYAQIEEQAT